MRSFLLFIGSFLLLSGQLFAQAKEELLYEEYRKQTVINSYYDSASVFSTGEKALEFARKLEDKGKEAEILILFGNHFYYNNQFQRAKDYFTAALYTANAGNDLPSIHLARIRLNYLKLEEGFADEAWKNINNILEESKNSQDARGTIEAYNALGIMSEANNKPQEAGKYYLEALKVAEKNNLRYYIAVELNNLGLIKLNAGDDAAALIDFERGLAIASVDKHLRLAGHIQNNIGLILLSQKKLEEGLRHYQETIRYARQINHPKELAVSYINLGSALFQNDRIDEAEKYYDSAMAVLDSNNMDYELTKAMLGKTQMLLDKGLFNEALSMAKQTRELSVTTNNLEDKAGSHMLLYRIYDKMKLADLALQEYKTYRDLNDSLNDLRNDATLKELQVQYGVEKKENELEQEKNKSKILEQENELKRVRIRILIYLLTGVSLLLGLIFYVRSVRHSRRQQEMFSQQLISSIEKERSRISRDLHDDIGQSLSVIKSRLTILAREGDAQSTKLEQEVGKIIEQTREISRSLYPSYLEKIGLVRSIARLAEIVQAGSNIEFSFEVDESIDQESLEVRTHLYRIIQECVNNTLKHSGASALKINLEKINENYILTFRDNGKGILSEKENFGLGFLSIKERSRMIGGDVNFGDNSGKGVRITIKFNPQKLQA
jgi:signal transduction histidine kinase